MTKDTFLRFLVLFLVGLNCTQVSSKGLMHPASTLILGRSRTEPVCAQSHLWFDTWFCFSIPPQEP